MRSGGGEKDVGEGFNGESTVLQDGLNNSSSPSDLFPSSSVLFPHFFSTCLIFLSFFLSRDRFSLEKLFLLLQSFLFLQEFVILCLNLVVLLLGGLDPRGPSMDGWMNVLQQLQQSHANKTVVQASAKSS